MITGIVGRGRQWYKRAMDVFSPIDLHCHSTASDGTLSPTEVVRRASGRGVRVLALTDHDSVDGVPEAAAEARKQGMHLIPGAELSCAWEGRELHVIALNVDPGDPELTAALASVRERRVQRIHAMAERLEARGLSGIREAVAGQAGESMPTRSHLARALQETGRVRTHQEAFDRYLRRGKPGWLRPDWPHMAETVALIRRAGGRAVLAHPMAYRMTGAWLRRTVHAFRDAGGAAVEVVCGNTGRQQISTALGQTLRAGLMGSTGSDFHGPDNPWIELGRLAPLPPAVKPVWCDWPDVMVHHPDPVPS